MTRFWVAAATAACCASCSLSAEREPMASSKVAAEAEAPAAPPMPAAGFGMAADKVEAKRPRKKKARMESRAAGRMLEGKDSATFMEAPKEADEDEAEAPARSWFPETFLFVPSVVTDAQGRAEYVATVPDRLTTWRVLALAHTRSGEQAGAVTRFAGTLPVYVDPVVPSFAVAGDRIRTPVQVVNNTAKPVRVKLTVEAEGARVASAPKAALSVRPHGSVVRYVELVTERPSQVKLHAGIAGRDKTERTFDVVPSGRPIVLQRSGTLAAPRTIELDAPADLDPHSARVRLTVFPGALALLRSELATAAGRGGVAEDAYALLVAGRAPALLRALGDEPDTKALRKMGLLAAQRVVRHARSPDLATSVLLAEAALAHPDNPILANLGKRLVGTIHAKQRPDGTFAGGRGWTLQRLLVATAEATRAARADDADADARRRGAGVALRASFAFERHTGRVDDAYTAAAILASGAVSGTLAERLRGRVRKAVALKLDGRRVLTVPKGVVRSDSRRPSVIEATALAALALSGEQDAALRADLGASLLAGYAPARGWGDGRANLACLSAVLELFRDPVPAGVRVSLSLDGNELAAGVLDAAQLRDVVTLQAPAAAAAKARSWSIRAEPPVPGLGYSLSLFVWVPWRKSDTVAGLDLDIQLPDSIRVGKAATVTLRATAPSSALEIEHSLPAGVHPDERSLEALVASGAITSYEVQEGQVTLHAPRRAQGQLLSARYRVVPTFAGTLHSRASSISAQGRKVHLPPARWRIQPR